MRRERTQVGIVGAGPAGLMLANLLRMAGIASVIVESRSREYCETRVRAGLMEQGSADLLAEVGAGERVRREALVHHGIQLRFDGRNHRIDIGALTGRAVHIYGQQEVVKDLIATHIAAGGDLRFEVSSVALEGLTGTPAIRYIDAGGNDARLDCDFIAGCDGFHGISRPSIPAGVLREYDRIYPFAWLGILSQSAPVDPELIYVNHPDGFALFSMRSPSVVRLYVQVDVDDDVANWSDDRVWSALHRRLQGHDELPPLAEGTVSQKGITQMRSFVAEPMRFERLFLAGDAAHIVPPTGAKGMNLALADVAVLASAFAAYYRSGSESLLDAYSDTALRRVWKTQRFSSWMTSLLHRFDGRAPFDERLQRSELEYVTSSAAAAASLAEQYAGLPIERG